MSEEVYSRIIYAKDHYQVRLTVNVFNGVEYIHLRKYFLDFDEEWIPTKEGIAMPLEISNSQELFSGLVEILSLAESKDIIQQQFSELIKDLYQT